MGLSDIFTDIRGWCSFTASGPFPERLLNLAVRHELGLWDIVRSEQGCEAKIVASRYRRLLPLARKCQMRLRVKQKNGLPFKLTPYSHRAGLPLGTLIFCGTIWFLSLFIWYIELPTGLSPETSLLVEQRLEESGLRAGVLRSRISGKLIADEMIFGIPDISWAGVSIIGSSARVEVKEIKNELRPPDRSQPCNIVASRSGVILSMLTTAGQPVAARGDTVAKGELLISGVMEYSDGSVWFAHSQGEVIAQTGYTLLSRVEYKQERSRRTGRVVNIRRVMVLGLELPLYLGDYPQGDYEREVVDIRPELAGVELPIRARTERWFELERVLVSISREEALALAKRDMEKQLAALGDIDIIERLEDCIYTDTAVEYTVNITATENIAEPSVILLE